MPWAVSEMTPKLIRASRAYSLDRSGQQGYVQVAADGRRLLLLLAALYLQAAMHVTGPLLWVACACSASGGG